MKRFLSAVCLSFVQLAVFGAVPEFTFDRTVHDFGDITVSDGPQSCTFTITNTGVEELFILSVVSSCGCTNVSWTRESIPAGGCGEIKATYSNEDGPYPFDKTLSVYLSGTKKPVILHIRGSVHSKRLPLSQTYPAHIGKIGLRGLEEKVGNMDQGQTRSSEFMVANISRNPVTLGWADVSAQLTLPGGTVTIEPGETARVVFSLRSDRTLWGKNTYYATPVVDGKPQDTKVTFWAITRESFASLTESQRKVAPAADFSEGSVEYRIDYPAGTEYPSFFLKNPGKSTLKIYRVQPDNERISVLEAPETLAPGKGAVLKFSVDLSGLGKDSENLYVVSIYTNSPGEPVVHLYINAIIL